MTPSDFLAFLRPTLHLNVCTTRQLAILALLAEAGEPMDFKAAALNLGISKPALTRNMDTLQRQNTAFRTYMDRASGGDCRKVSIEIVDEGWKFLDRIGVRAI
jgi:DNA-binding MarR family transcriptional regulator